MIPVTKPFLPPHQVYQSYLYGLLFLFDELNSCKFLFEVQYSDKLFNSKKLIIYKKLVFNILFKYFRKIENNIFPKNYVLIYII